VRCFCFFPENINLIKIYDISLRLLILENSKTVCLYARMVYDKYFDRNNAWKGFLKKLTQAEHLTIKSFVSQTALEILLLKSNNHPFAFICLLK